MCTRPSAECDLAVLSLIKAHALLHQEMRQRDADGRVVASIDDYAVVRDIVAEVLSEGIQATVSDSVREAVQAVEQITAETSAPASLSQVARRLQLDNSAASRRVTSARSKGYVINEEERKGRPLKLRIGEPMPEELGILPDPCSVAVDFEGDK
jgi:hypothetical protein